jgi:hypothetical protein
LNVEEIITKAIERIFFRHRATRHTGTGFSRTPGTTPGPVKMCEKL